MAKIFTLILGAVLVLVGIAGFITGGHDHELLLFGINTTHNLVHLLSGAIGIAAAMAGERAARMFCFVFGAVYGLVAVAGFLNLAPVVRLLNLNRPDDFLHVFIAAGCLVVATVSARRARMVGEGPSRPAADLRQPVRTSPRT